MNPNAGEPANPSGGVALAPEPSITIPSTNIGSSDQVANLQDVVDAAREEAAANPIDQFNAQFGSGATPPAAEVPELKPEENPQATFVKDIKAAVEKLEKATKEKVAA
ncbi:MAG: hypothetical protein HYW62_01650 [Candidatus Levybacteria bacterium]|nr:hypothetical protein [Candidatus Levybacteria bacterium]